MKKKRIISRLDIKGPNVVKGIHLEGLRVVGDPAELAKKYYEQGADELLYIDIVASLYERNNLLEIVEKTTSKGFFIPMTVGGGVRTLDDIKNLLRAGADKVAINTKAVKTPNFITKAAEMFGSQCIMGSIEAKYRGDNKWEAYTENGRERTGVDVVEWAKKLVELGAGELLITSIDREGTGKGYEIELVKRIVSSVSVPVIACGGAGSIDDIYKCFNETKCDAISLASFLHYNKISIEKIKEHLAKKNIPIRDSYKTKTVAESRKQKKPVSVIDYGLGNLKSVIKAFESIGSQVKIVSTPEEIVKSELLVLPGVGAFADGMKGLKERGLVEAIKEYTELNKPFLGICLGMQLLMSESEEFGKHKGLNIIEGTVTKFKPILEIGEEDYRVPHVGWNNLIKPDGVEWKNTILSVIPNNSEVYFVHSFFVTTKNIKYSLATVNYGNQNFCAVIKKGNIYGTQFHPEKSGEIGIDILRFFSNL